MGRTTYDADDRHLLSNLSIREEQILRRLAALIGVRGLAAGEYEVKLSDFIGRGYDARDIARISAYLADMDQWH